MEENGGISPATPDEASSALEPIVASSALEPIVATITVKLTYRGSGEAPKLGELADDLRENLSGNGLAVSVTSIERTDK